MLSEIGRTIMMNGYTRLDTLVKGYDMANSSGFSTYVV